MIKQISLLLSLVLIGLSASSNAQKDSIALQREARKLLRNGNKLYFDQKFNDAAVAYKKALGKNASYNKATYNMGNALYQDGNYQEAIPQFELAVKAAKDKVSKAEAYHNIGNAHMKGKNYQGAVDAFKNSLRNNPNDDETRYNLAVAQELLEKENQKNQDQNKDKNKNDQNKDKQDQDKDGDNKDNKDPDKKDQGDQDKDKQKQDPNKKDENKQKPKPRQGKMSPEQIKQLLENLNKEEKKTQKKLNAKKARGTKTNKEKDW